MCYVLCTCMCMCMCVYVHCMLNGNADLYLHHMTSHSICTLTMHVNVFIV